MNVALLKRQMATQMEHLNGESGDDSVSISLDFNNSALLLSLEETYSHERHLAKLSTYLQMHTRSLLRLMINLECPQFKIVLYTYLKTKVRLLVLRLNLCLDGFYTGSDAFDLVTSLLLPDTIGKHRVVKFAQRYRLAFTLLNEDAAAGRSPLSWDFGNSFSCTSHWSCDESDL